MSKITLIHAARGAAAFATVLAGAAAIAATGTQDSGTRPGAGIGAIAGVALSGDPGITVPGGFTAEIFADDVGRARQITVRGDGTVYVALQRPQEGKGIAVLRDEDGDGKADFRRYVGDGVRGTGIELRGEWLYFGADDRVVRWRLPKDSVLPVGAPETIVTGFNRQRAHAAKPIDFDDRGRLIVNHGAPSNACQERQRTPGSPGRMPCPELEYGGGIWRYDADTPNQNHPADGQHVATGLRHCVALDYSPRWKALYAVPHGRDQLNSLWPDFYTAELNAELPAEEVHRIVMAEPDEAGEPFNGGWPYGYWNHLEGKRILAPEYGGDGKTATEPGKYAEPIEAFPGHWAPNDVLFYDGEQFPERYRGGMFIAWHGSWNRAPLRQGGYKVTFTPYADGLPSAAGTTFADGFAGVEIIRSPREAKHRPMGLAVGPDGSLFIADSVRGRIWRIRWTGGADTGGTGAGS